MSTRPLALATLLFESRGERRRLTPAPDAWRALPDDELEDLLNRTTLERAPLSERPPASRVRPADT